ncbi:fas apoptotic inhibitory molecule 3 isoform X1 [Sapajus apella]|uniref:Fas apoptotic inhibitory molecule 3 isoform X1 n=1 Tax=Sapajus apella TaxID=9515 RepID=A0A6J3IR21_SAPAP|nr:fas apoptotic inhibitory molecule 3 isoform X1 [Sapajus apella]
MDPWLWLLYFLPVSGALRILPEVKVEGELGGSVTITCPLPETPMRIYLCREMAESRACATVVSTNNFIKNEYKGRVTLTQNPHKNLFLVKVTELTRNDSGVYACGAGIHTDGGKTQKVTLNVHSEYEPLWKEQPAPETPNWFHLLHLFQMPAHAGSSKSVPRVTTPAQRTKVPPVHHPSPTTQIIHRPQVSRASSIVADKPPTLLPSTTASEISARGVLLKPRTVSYSHHTRLHRQRALDYGSQSGREGQGFHILIPTVLGLFLLALLVLMVKRAVHRRKALSRRARRLAVRMRGLESSQPPRGSQQNRSQNIYSACPRRAPGADAAGNGETPVPGSRAPLSPALLQVSESPWLHTPSLKTSCEYASLYFQPAAKMEDSDSNDYINVPA